MSKNKSKKLWASLLLILLIPNLVLATPEEGKFSRLLPGQTIPYEAWCFDDIATARIQASLEFSKKNCQLQIDKQLAKQKADLDLKIDNLQVRYDTLKASNEEIIGIKDQEIKELEAAALKRPNDYSYFWFGGGTAVGILTTLAVVYAVK